MSKNEQSVHCRLQRISNTLMINGGFLSNLGLYSGERGLVLFFLSMRLKYLRII
jgi:hypothetical protein